MSKPIDSVDFWKERIDTAQKEQYSVYVTGEHDWRRIFEAHRRTISEVIPEGSSVLDAGCGYGRMSELFDTEKYVGIDFSPDFVRKSMENYPGNVFYRMNMKKLDFEDGEFDWAICVSIRKMVQDNLGDAEWLRMLAELKRVAGKVLVLEYEDPEPFEIL